MRPDLTSLLFCIVQTLLAAFVLLPAGLAPARPLAVLAELDQIQEPLPPPLKPLALPAGLSLPWRLIQIDIIDRSASRPALDASATALASSWLKAPASLSAFVGDRHIISLNQHLVSDHIQTGQPLSAVSLPSLTVEPSWCSVLDQHVFFVTVASTSSNQLLASAHQGISRQSWQAMAPAARTSYLTTLLPRLSQEAFQQLAQRPNAGAGPLHVSLHLARNASRDDEGSSLCLTQLLEEQLAAKVKVARSQGGDHLALTRSLLDQSAAMLRANRSLLIDWQRLGDNGARRLPVAYNLRMQELDGVFGKHLGTLTSLVNCTVAGSSGLSCSRDEHLDQLLSAESATLNSSDWPQVAKVDRAWAYLDRGRAWGLKMNDRVIAEVNGQLVKGHVVRFFGPEAKLRSPRGFPIQEGAIVYVRLHQRLAHRGVEFRMDPRSFPTPLPPPPATATAH